MWNNLSIFITIYQGFLALLKFFFSGNKKTYDEIYNELEINRLKRKFRKLKKDHYNCKYIKGAQLLFILKDYFHREKAKKFIVICNQAGYISYDGDFDVNRIITIRKEDEFIEKIINSRKS